nr:Uncharacterised protein [Streptococcus thermophilus]
MPGQPGQFAGAGAAGGGGPYGQGPSQASGFASVPSSGAGGNKGGKGPLIAAGALGAVALLGIGGWAVTRGGDDTDGSTEASSTAPAATESESAPADGATSSPTSSSPTSSTSSAPGSKYVTIGELVDDDSFLPEGFKGAVRKCDIEGEPANDIWIKWIDDPAVTSHYCTMKLAEGDTDGVHNVQILMDDNATEAIETMKRKDGKDEFEVEDVRGGGPDVYIVKPEKYRSPQAVVHYPDKQLVAHFSGKGDSDEQAKEYLQGELKKFGFR